MTYGLLSVAVFALCFSMIARRLTSTVLTAPMLFIGFGYLLSGMDILPHRQAEAMLHVVAEVALILLLSQA